MYLKLTVSKLKSSFTQYKFSYMQIRTIIYKVKVTESSINSKLKMGLTRVGPLLPRWKAVHHPLVGTASDLAIWPLETSQGTPTCQHCSLRSKAHIEARPHLSYEQEALSSLSSSDTNIGGFSLTPSVWFFPLLSHILLDLQGKWKKLSC